MILTFFKTFLSLMVAKSNLQFPSHPALTICSRDDHGLRAPSSWQVLPALNGLTEQTAGWLSGGLSGGLICQVTGPGSSISCPD